MDSWELGCRFDSCQSFYGKAMVTKDIYDDRVEYKLYSYKTLVAKINEYEDKTIFEIVPYDVDGRTKTPTTTRHQKEFFKQNGLGDDLIKKLFKEGKIEI